MDQLWHDRQQHQGLRPGSTERLVFIGFTTPVRRVHELIRSLANLKLSWVKRSELHFLLDLDSSWLQPVILELSLSPSTWGMTETGLTAQLTTSYGPCLRRFGIRLMLLRFVAVEGLDLAPNGKLTRIEL